MDWQTEKLIKVLARLERVREVITTNSGRMNANHHLVGLQDLTVINDLITDILLQQMSALEIDAAVREEVCKYRHIKAG